MHLLRHLALVCLFAAAPTNAQAQQLREAWLGELDVDGRIMQMQFRVYEGVDGGAPTVLFDSLTQGVPDIGAELIPEDGWLVLRVPLAGAEFRGELGADPDRVAGHWTQRDRDFPVVLNRKDEVFANPITWARRAQRPKGPYPYYRKRVKIANDAAGIELAATLTLPKGEGPNGTGRFPVAVLISGSGPQDRDQTMLEHKPFLVIAHYLTSHGIAVLRYDDRGTAKSTGVFEGATTVDLASDTAAIVAYLKTHRRIDHSAIGLIGHSEGGLIAPMLAAEDHGVAWIVLLGATGVPGAEIVLEQTRRIGTARGMQSEDIELDVGLHAALLGSLQGASPEDPAGGQEAARRALREYVETLPEARREAGAQAAQLLESQLPMLTGPWYRFFASYDPTVALRRVQVPVLALTGSKDLQVPPDQNLPKIREALTEAGNPDVTIVEIDGLNHLFQTCTTGSPGEYFQLEETFHEPAIEQIRDWILARFVADRSGR